MGVVRSAPAWLPGMPRVPSNAVNVINAARVPGAESHRHQVTAWIKPRMLSSAMTLPTRIIKGWSGILYAA
jgi:hypothetical protein